MRLNHRKSPPRDFVEAVDRRPPAPSPFVVIVDTREQAPYTFAGLKQDAVEGGQKISVQRQWKALRSGDYSIAGYEDKVAVERKSLADLYSTLAKGRDRFEREMDRLAVLDAACVVVEASWGTILGDPPKRSRLPPKTVLRTCLAWTQRYGVPWLTFDSRRLAEIGTYRYLERWWRDYQEESAAPGDRCRYCGRPLTDKRSIDCGMGPWCRKRKVREMIHGH